MWRGKNKKGKEVVLLNPAEKGRKAAAELKAGVHATNDHKIKKDANGQPLRLSKEARSYRAGYLDARKDSANAWKAGKKNSESP